MQSCGEVEETLLSIDVLIRKLKKQVCLSFSSVIELETALSSVYTEYENKSEKFCKLKGTDMKSGKIIDVTDGGDI
jgi:archaellum component FlaC